MHKALMRTIGVVTLMVGASWAMAADTPPAQQQKPAQAARPARPQPAARDPNTPGFVEAKEIEDGAVPSPDQDGNFILGPTHKKSPLMTLKEGRQRALVSIW